jgi:hypothetical protein
MDYAVFTKESDTCSSSLIDQGSMYIENEVLRCLGFLPK